MIEFLVDGDIFQHERRERIKQAIIDDGGDGSDWAVDLIEKQTVGAGICLEVNPKVMSKFIETCSASKKTIAKRILSSEWQIDEWCKKKEPIEIWKLKVMATFNRKYNWLVFLLKDARKMP